MVSRLFVRARPSGVARPRIRAERPEPARQPTAGELKARYAKLIREQWKDATVRDDSVA